MDYYIGLGSNLGQLETQLKNALQMIENSGQVICARSSLYRTEPVGFEGQAWFVNQVIMVRSQIEPDRMLMELKTIEENMGRRKTIPNGPRTIDLDILLAGDIIMQMESLIIPHPLMHMRRFVLIPLAEIAPHVRHPVYKKSARQLLRECRDKSRVRLIQGPENHIDP